ncbi:Inhibitor of apoptosis-promoting Bax1 [Stieleria bergensis]|uniref:Inhibitor of apoptosis-promoting Bax1 n=1 Tax=Stieleria bergensis TaxID=2528025 RepID=A0A517SYD4_9BACT|nr:MAG: permease [Rhodopirellula sp. TMED11]QDT61073.1 Inhibitor of apoptosis-promoting Bax1 [Planctomycetes bacterium SV_7m_r]
MSFGNHTNPYQVTDAAMPAAFADESARAGFIRRTYVHLGCAIAALVAIEALIFGLTPQDQMLAFVKSVNPLMWIGMLGLFMVVGWVARYWASHSSSVGMQYAGLGLYVVAEAILLLPLLFVSIAYVDPQLPLIAAIITLVVFGGLSAFVFVTRADLSGIGPYLFVAGMGAFVAVVVGAIMGFSLGIWFSVAMVVLASGYILYDTSNVLHHYRTDQHVAASLALFASVTLLFWYVLRLALYFASEE